MIVTKSLVFGEDDPAAFSDLANPFGVWGILWEVVGLSFDAQPQRAE